MDRILNPKNDFAFKKLFGEAKHKDILISFLNDIFEGVQEKIEDVEFLPLHQNVEIAMLRQSVVDVLCRDKDGNSWIIEMQCARDSSFIKRATSYACRVYLNQRTRNKSKDASVRDAGVREDTYGNLKPVIFLAVLDHILFPEKKAYLSHHQIIDIETQERDIKDFSFSFLELEKFNKNRVEEIETDIEKWVYFFKNAQSINIEDRERIERDSPAIEGAYKALEEGAFTTDELLEYERYEMKADEVATAISDALKKGKKEGLAEGLVEGREEGLKEGLAEGELKGELKKARETACNLLSMGGLTVEQIATATGLSIEDIEKLKHRES